MTEEREVSFRLYVVPPDGRPFTVELEGETLVGRHPDCDLRLDHPTVSANHALFEVKGRSVAINDLGSTNGTYVDDQPVDREQWLRHNAVIRMGEYRLDLVAVRDSVTETAKLEKRRVALDDRDRELIAALMRDWSDASVRVPAPRGAEEMSEQLHCSRQEVNRRVGRLESKLGVRTETRGAKRYHELAEEILARGLQPGPGSR